MTHVQDSQEVLPPGENTILSLYRRFTRWKVEKNPTWFEGRPVVEFKVGVRFGMFYLLARLEGVEEEECVSLRRSRRELFSAMKENILLSTGCESPEEVELFLSSRGF